MNNVNFACLIAENIKRIMKEKNYSEVEVYALLTNTFEFNSYDIARILYPTKNQWGILPYSELEKISQWFSVGIGDLLKGE